MAGLDGDVKVPGVGREPKKVVYGALLVVGTLVGVYYYRKRNAAAAAPAASAATDRYPPDGTTGNPQDPYSTDPATGQTYGDEGAGSGGTYGAYGTGSGTDAYPWDGTYGNSSDPYSMDPSTGQTYGNEGGGDSGGGSSGPPFSNNEAWENWALQQLQTDDPNFPETAAVTALGLYLNGQPVDAAQKTLIFDARGIAGDPPVAGTNNYPPNIRTNGSRGGGGGTVVPDCKGHTAGEAHDLITAAGLKPTDPHGAVSGEASWPCTGTRPPAGKKVQDGSEVEILTDKPVTVPDVVGHEAGQAHNTLTRAGLKPEDPDASRPGEPRRKVISQDPRAGDKAAKGSKVTIHT